MRHENPDNSRRDCFGGHGTACRSATSVLSQCLGA